MNNVEEQAKSEIQELLTDYVVTPVSNNIDKKMEGLTTIVDTLPKIPNKIGALQGQITRESSKLESKLNDIETHTKTSTNLLNKIKGSATSISTSVEKLNNVPSDISEIKEAIKESVIQELLTNYVVTPVSNNIDKKMEGLTNEVSFLHDVPKKIETVQGQITEESSKLERKLGDIETSTKDSTKLLNKIKESSTSISVSVEKLNNVPSDISEIKEAVKKSVIQELLRDYVVTPISDNISQKMDEVSGALTTLKELQEKTNSISTNIEDISKKIEQILAKSDSNARSIKDMQNNNKSIKRKCNSLLIIIFIIIIASIWVISKSPIINFGN